MEEGVLLHILNAIALPDHVAINEITIIGFNPLGIGINGLCWLHEIKEDEIRASRMGISDEEVL